jgi:hypothetical protein
MSFAAVGAVAGNAHIIVMFFVRWCLQNRRNTPERLEIKKYNPNLRRYTVHREVK